VALLRPENGSMYMKYAFLAAITAVLVSNVCGKETAGVVCSHQSSLCKEVTLRSLDDVNDGLELLHFGARPIQDSLQAQDWSFELLERLSSPQQQLLAQPFPLPSTTTTTTTSTTSTTSQGDKKNSTGGGAAAATGVELNG